MGGLILLTGATGFLGSQLARLLLRDTDHRLAVLVRGQDEEDARSRLGRVWSDWPETDEALADGRVRVLPGDLCRPGLGLEPGTYAELARTLTHIVHAAAELKLDGELEELRRVNVGGTERLLELARAAHADHGLQRYAHVSTAYVAGGRTGEVAEGELTDRYGFCNAYEQTKYEGELKVREAMRELPVSVFRPGMVVGDAHTGEIRCFNTVYVPLRLYLSGRLRLIPAKPELRMNLVPVDYVASAIARLLFDPRATGLTFHLTVDPDHLPRAQELLQAARSWAVEGLGEKLPPARFIPLQALARLPGAAKLPVPSFLLSYFSEDRRFRRDNVERLLGPYVPDWEAILPRLLDYAVSRGFLHRSGRTVHEQVLFRLQSRRLPVRVHDLSADGSQRMRGGAELAREIAAAAGALRALGVRRGDRVALVGLNSSRYLVLDTAVGLTGAVSVPLYYTSPPDEIEGILRASGARLLLVGAPGVMARVGQLRTQVPIASFLLNPLPEGLESRVIPWEAFLALGRKAGGPPPAADGPARKAAAGSPRRVALQAPVGFDDPATLRFTSGTTGTPRGTAFRHGQVLWLAETMTSLLPWRARVRPARYLSFLPMNHVVEGILGTYAPYYLPAPVDVWFLEDFHALSQALPRVRPTVFFSVPRFYEKVWERFAEQPAGRLYLGLPAGGLRGALRPLARRAVLRRAGLDRCDQLLVGSAPCPDRLLGGFHELGVEIHNAYGLTEAPLVTLNRRGSNRLGTVGRPLPATEVRLAPDGEILVRGPQVGRGEGPEDSLLPGGWLATGDLGELRPDGRLVIRGRKKEILVTAYGKNIHPARIEALLRQIPGMAEVMLVGEGRPSLCALLWLKNGSASPCALESVDRAVRQLNQGLSHPEQVRRWAVLAESPSIDSGELTGNLKLRRQVVLARRAGVVEMLYGGSDRRGAGAGGEPSGGGGPAVGLAPEVLHVGAGR
jgi:long-chain acyl-CoA synthetase